MMKSPLSGSKIAFLVANGLDEADLIEAQKTVQALGADTRIISMDQGLVSSLNDKGWGLNFAADQALNQSLAADYSALVIPGGRRSVEKLQLTAHTKRFINGFYTTGKPVCIIDEAVELLKFAEIDQGSASDNLLLIDSPNESMGQFLKNILLAEEAFAA